MNIPPMVGPAGVTRAYRHRPRKYQAVMESTQASIERSRDYGAPLIRALETHEPLRFHGNVVNKGYVKNLNASARVKVPAFGRGGYPNPERRGADAQGRAGARS